MVRLLRQSLQRPRLFHTGSADQAVHWYRQLKLLAWIDERDGVAEAERSRLARTQLLHPPEQVDGAAMALRRAMPDVSDVEPEAASVWAEAAFRAGYLELDRVLGEPQIDELLGSMGELWLRRERDSLAIIEQFGEPSLVLGGTSMPGRATTGVLVYASNRRWVCFDFDGEPPRLRSVRRLGEPWEAGGLVLTAFGKTLTRRQPVVEPVPVPPEGWEEELLAKTRRLRLVTEPPEGES